MYHPEPPRAMSSVGCLPVLLELQPRSWRSTVVENALEVETASRKATSTKSKSSSPYTQVRFRVVGPSAPALLIGLLRAGCELPTNLDTVRGLNGVSGRPTESEGPRLSASSLSARPLDASASHARGKVSARRSLETRTGVMPLRQRQSPVGRRGRFAVLCKGGRCRTESGSNRK